MVSANRHSCGETFIDSGMGLSTGQKTLSKLGSSQWLEKIDIRSGRGGEEGKGIDSLQETRWSQLQVTSSGAVQTQPGTLPFFISCVCSPVTSCQSSLLGKLLYSLQFQKRI